jgi:hypothetical protein
MFDKFQGLIKTILENVNSSGAGGCFGTPQQGVYNPPTNINSTDSFASGDGRNIFSGVFNKPKHKGKKRKKGKKVGNTPLVIKRNLQRGAY